MLERLGGKREPARTVVVASATAGRSKGATSIVWAAGWSAHSQVCGGRIHQGASNPGGRLMPGRSFLMAI